MKNIKFSQEELLILLGAINVLQTENIHIDNPYKKELKNISRKLLKSLN